MKETQCSLGVFARFAPGTSGAPHTLCPRNSLSAGALEWQRPCLPKPAIQEGYVPLGRSALDIVSLSDFLETEAGCGRTLQDIGEHFTVSKRTAQRDLAALREMANSPLREEWRGRQRVYRVVRHAPFEQRGFPREKTLGVVELRLAAKVMEILGCYVAAKRLSAHVEGLMSGMARAHRIQLERAVECLLNRLDIKQVVGVDPIPWSKTVEALHLAILSERQIEVCVSGRSLKGQVVRIHYAGASDSKVLLDDGTIVPLKEIQSVAGLHDLKRRLL